MSVFSRCLKINKGNKQRGLYALLGIACVFLVCAPSMASENKLKEQGGGSYRWLGIKIYDARLMVAPAFSGNYLKDRPMALEITYGIDIDKNDLVETTLDEMNDLKIGQSQQCKNKQLWAAELRTIWPNLKQGDTLKYQINLDDSSDFYHNKKAIGSISDRNFSACFISIWLAADTSAKDLRKKLLGMAAR